MITAPLSPCPFCEAEAKIMLKDGKEVSSDLVKILCSGCGASTRSFDAGNSWQRSDLREKAISKAAEAWNQRKG